MEVLSGHFLLPIPPDCPTSPPSPPTGLVILNPPATALFEEPDALIVLVRVCGKSWATAALPGRIEVRRRKLALRL